MKALRVICLGFIIVVCAILVFVYYQRTNSSQEMASRKTYTAAVVDYHPLGCEPYKSPEEYMLANAAEYVSMIKTAGKSDVDIIVFPEYGLSNISPYHPNWSTINFAVEIPPLAEPFESQEHNFSASQEILKALAKAAKENKMYVVVNLVEKVNCSQVDDYPAEKFIYYNSNIVFNRNGCIISRYRKFNLYGEAMVTEKEANVCTFKTDFQVTFGMFICFDILFGNPSLRLITEKGVTDVIFSTAWFSELPFFAATGVQSGWAHSMDVNFLASGYRNPETGSGGSGIYNGGHGALTVTVPANTNSELLIAKVPIKQNISVQMNEYPAFSFSSFHDGAELNHKEMLEKEKKLFYKSNFFGDWAFKKDPSLTSMSTVLLEPDKADPSLSTFTFLNDEKPGFTASVTVKWRLSSPYKDSAPRYRLFSFDGVRLFDVRKTSVSVCGIAVCADETIDSCGLVPNIESSTKTMVESIEILIKSHTLTLGYLPITMDFSLNQLPVTAFKFSKKFIQLQNETMCVVQMILLEPVDDLFVFSVYKIPG